MLEFITVLLGSKSAWLKWGVSPYVTFSEFGVFIVLCLCEKYKNDISIFLHITFYCLSVLTHIHKLFKWDLICYLFSVLELHNISQMGGKFLNRIWKIELYQYHKLNFADGCQGFCICNKWEPFFSFLFRKVLHPKKNIFFPKVVHTRYLSNRGINIHPQK